MTEDLEHDEDLKVRLATVIMLGLILLTAVICITFVAVLTDRDLWKVEILTFGGVVLLAGLGGISWFTLRRHHWHLRVDRNGEDHDD